MRATDGPRPRRRSLAPERLEARLALALVLPSPLPQTFSYPPAHTFNEVGITQADGSVTSTGITDTATPRFLISIRNPVYGTPEVAFHDFEIQVKLAGNGATIGTYMGHAGDVVGDPDHPLVVPVDPSTPLAPGENDIRFRLTDLGTAGDPMNLSLPLPAAARPPLVVLYDNAAPVVTLTPPPPSAVNGPIAVEVADPEDGVSSVVLTDRFAGRPDRVVTLSGPADTATEIGPVSYSFPKGETGPHAVTVTATARSGLATTVSGLYTNTFSDVPAPGVPALRASSDSGIGHADRITNARALTFDVKGVQPRAELDLYRDGVRVAAIRDPAGGTVAITDPGPVPQGSHAYSADQVDGFGNRSPRSGTTTVVVDRTAPAIRATLATADLAFTGDPTATATASRSPRITVVLADRASRLPNPLSASIVAIDGTRVARPVVGGTVLAPQPGSDLVPASGTITLDVPGPLAPGRHTVTIAALDAAGNVARTFTTAPINVLAVNPAVGAPATPAYTQTFDLGGLPGYKAGQPIFPWSQAFDTQTQTDWIILRGGDEVSGMRGGGDSIMQLDPATRTARVYDLRALEPGGNATRTNSEPHGVAFDFESHLTPRVWITQREAGLVSFLDPTTDRFVSYDVGTVLRRLGLHTKALQDLHAIAVDRTGDVWVTDLEDMLVIELDFHHLPGDPAELPLDSLKGSLIIHPIPKQLFQGGALAKGPGRDGEDLLGDHGIDTVQDFATGQILVFFSEVGPGRVGELLPGAGPAGSDSWSTWDIGKALGGTKGGVPLFVNVDTTETPGYPAAYRVYYADPGTVVNPIGIIRELDLGLPRADGTAPAATLRSWQVPTDVLQGAKTAQPNQVFADHEGTLYYIDRQAGVGRLSPIVPAVPDAGRGAGGVVQAAAINAKRPALAPILLQPSRVVSLGPARPIPLKTTTAAAPDLSRQPGIGQYTLVGPQSKGKGAGPFRGAISIGGALFGSLTQSDQVGEAIFAETDRRPMTVATGPGGVRMAFQVTRTGRLILTARAAGALVDSQQDLTTLVSGLPEPATPGDGIVPDGFLGDASAVADARGVVHVYGRDPSGGLAEYRFDPGSQAWTYLPLGPPPAGSGTLADNPTALAVGGRAAALVTTDRGHLVLFMEGARPVDLTAEAGGSSAARVYSTVGVVAWGGVTYAYGTNQLGGLVEYAMPAAGPPSFRPLPLPGGLNTRVFQDVTAILQGSTRQVFATDGNGRLVHVAIAPDGGVSAENVTLQALPRAAGYIPYERPFAGRVDSGVSAAVDPTDGDLYVYGTDGRDLIEFRKPRSGPWQVTDLTGFAANRVFGAPVAMIEPNGDRHILMVNADAEVVEYAKLAGTTAFSTINITLNLGNSGAPPAFPA